MERKSKKLEQKPKNKPTEHTIVMKPNFNISEDLELECSLFAADYAFWVKQLASFKVLVAEGQDDVRRLYAMLDINFRQSGEKYTENSIRAAIEANPEYIHIKATLQEREAELTKMEAVIEGYRMKAKMIENLVSLSHK